MLMPEGQPQIQHAAKPYGDEKERIMPEGLLQIQHAAKPYEKNRSFVHQIQNPFVQ